MAEILDSVPGGPYVLAGILALAAVALLYWAFKPRRAGTGTAAADSDPSDVTEPPADEVPTDESPMVPADGATADADLAQTPETLETPTPAEATAAEAAGEDLSAAAEVPAPAVREDDYQTPATRWVYQRGVASVPPLAPAPARTPVPMVTVTAAPPAPVVAHDADADADAGTVGNTPDQGEAAEHLLEPADLSTAELPTTEATVVEEQDDDFSSVTTDAAEPTDDAAPTGGRFSKRRGRRSGRKDETALRHRILAEEAAAEQAQAARETEQMRAVAVDAPATTEVVPATTITVAMHRTRDLPEALPPKLLG